MRNLNFPAKLNLCIALGLVQKECRNAALRINQMRNKVAHRLEFEFSDLEKSELFEMMPPFLQKHCLEDANLAFGEHRKLEWWRLLRIIVVWLDQVRQHHAENRVKEAIAQEHLRRVLDKSKKVVS